MDAMELEDSFLVGRISAGDPEAFARFFDRHAAAVLGLVVRILGAGGEAEEVLQEVFLQVWRQSERYEAGRSTPRGWLLMVARSRALDRLRRRDARGRHEQAAATDAAFPLVAAPRGTDRLEESERRAQIHSALNLLSPEQRRCIELAFFEGLTHTQIAERLAAPLGTVKSRILLGMNKLRQALST
ncbi:MAG TPA: sigma-70 family RNA polymerase sigma factor [Thermoanaerobaculia bacterium]|jgi:RNA polymerase sigma-70 factor (ECF subfamily)|nr:sigma-70 family RNA polymerase sigma factor [Thermoanaerobaculia bacterium]